MQIKKYYLWFIVFSLMIIELICCSNIVVHANNNGSIEYSVGAIIPKTQMNKEVSYFDVKVKSNQKQVLSTVISNHSNHDIFIKQRINNAYTNDFGQLNYNYNSKNAPKLDESMRYPLTKILKLDQQKILKVPANKMVRVDANLSPKTLNKFNGTILGGWYFEQVFDKNDDSSQIGVNYSYVLGIKLNVNAEVKPNICFGTINYHRNNNFVSNVNNLTINIRNVAPAIAHNLKLTAKVSDIKKNVKFNEKYSQISIAPNSNLTYDLVTNKRLVAGRYKLNLTIKDKKQSWSETRYFSLTKNKDNKLELKEINKPINKYLVGFYVSILFVLIIIIYLFCKNKKGV